MILLTSLIPDVSVLLALEPEKLGGQILAMFRNQPDALLSPGAILRHAWPTHGFGEGAYPAQSRQSVEMAIAEASPGCRPTGFLFVRWG